MALAKDGTNRGRKPGSKNRIKKPDAVRKFERYCRKYKAEPIEFMVATLAGKLILPTGEVKEFNLPHEMRYKAAVDLTKLRYQGQTIERYDATVAQQDMFEAAADNKLVFGVDSGRAA